MGQRSQIYIRYRNKDGINLIARYYQWNYSERMISRARGIVEYLYDRGEYLGWFLDDKNNITQLTRICDVNFDMRDIASSTDIIQEIKDGFMDEEDPISLLFNQDNNNGQLMIDVLEDKIKYGFVPFFDEFEKVLDGEEYMIFDNNDEPWDVVGEYMSQETIDYTKENIEKLKEFATLMTVEEMKEFVSYNYRNLIYDF